MLINLAWKNVWRNKKRSTIILLAVAFGLWAGIYSGAIWIGMGESMVDSAIDRQLGHIQIHSEGFLDNINIQNDIPEAAKMITVIATLDSVTHVAGRTMFEGMCASPTSSFGVRIVGVDPEVESKISSIHDKVIKGTYFNSNKRNTIVIGAKQADRLKLKINSKTVISFQSPDGDIQYEACRVVGIYKTNSTFFDQANIFLSQANLNKILGRDMIHEIVIRTHTSKAMLPVYNDLELRFANLDVENWKTLAPELDYTAAVMELFTYLFVGIILFALLFGIINTMLMSVLDRTRELGMLMAIGMSKLKIFGMILIETIFLSFSGAVIGLMIAWLTIAWSNMGGLDFTALSESLGSFGADTCSNVYHIVFNGVVYCYCCSNVAGNKSDQPATIKSNPELLKRSIRKWQ